MSFLFDDDLRAWNSYDRFTKCVLLAFIYGGLAAAIYLVWSAL